MNWVTEADKNIPNEAICKQLDEKKGSLAPLKTSLVKVKRTNNWKASEFAESLSNSSRRGVRIKLPRLEILKS